MRSAWSVLPTWASPFPVLIVAFAPSGFVRPKLVISEISLFKENVMSLPVWFTFRLLPALKVTVSEPVTVLVESPEWVPPSAAVATFHVAKVLTFCSPSGVRLSNLFVAALLILAFVSSLISTVTTPSTAVVAVVIVPFLKFKPFFNVTVLSAPSLSL